MKITVNESAEPTVLFKELNVGDFFFIAGHKKNAINVCMKTDNNFAFNFGMNVKMDMNAYEPVWKREAELTIL